MGRSRQPQDQTGSQLSLGRRQLRHPGGIRPPRWQRVIPANAGTQRLSHAPGAGHPHRTQQPDPVIPAKAGIHFCVCGCACRRAAAAMGRSRQPQDQTGSQLSLGRRQPRHPCGIRPPRWQRVIPANAGTQRLSRVPGAGHPHRTQQPDPVIPAHAGIHFALAIAPSRWVPTRGLPGCATLPFPITGRVGSHLRGNDGSHVVQGWR
jgi:hypothetical protein